MTYNVFSGTLNPTQSINLDDAGVDIGDWWHESGVFCAVGMTVEKVFDPVIDTVRYFQLAAMLALQVLY